MGISADKAHYELHLEKYLVEKLAANGWLVGRSNEYNTEYALYPDDLISWVQATQPEKWEKLCSLNGENAKKKLLDRLDEELGKKGNINVFRNGFSIAGAGNFDLTESAPEDERNQTTIDKYNANILRVVPQLKYNPAREFAIDLVFFINGLPMATVEIKTEFNQSIDDAIAQYRNDRKPIDPVTKRKEPLLQAKRGAIVHFALSESEIFMTTSLDGENTFFLPFNKGNNGHAGNPPADTAHGEDYPISYFWDYVCQPDNWLRIFHHFVYVEKKNKVDLFGNWTVQERLIFPRYHQFDAVNKIVADVKGNGVGLNYLCEHSAGSGKTATISWLCHSLIRLRHDDGDPFYNSIIVVTDRTVLDDQLQEAIKQLDHQKGLIAAINRDDKEQAGKSKSKQLEEALLSNKSIIIVTIQTFPHVMEAILTNTTLSDRSYGIVIDEAHNSQTGSTASKLKATLALESSADMASMSVEDLLEQIQKARVQSNSISHFAFTATPKHSTMMLFGRTDNGEQPTDENLPHSFHRYPMRQAIEEGFILDVLKGYVPYKTAFKLGGDAVKNQNRVEAKAAKKTLARWMTLHATNVTQKVQFIIQHFHHNVAHLLNGQAKAMIVTNSRPAAVRYKKALDKYIDQNPEYQAYRVMVAFSGKLTADQVMHEADEGDTFAIEPNAEFTEANMNEGLPNPDLRIAFDRPEYRLMVVANKFQTGFDQPKLCAMYLDKKIANEVEIVQTLSRLNRTTTGKDSTFSPFIIDFVNDPEWILECFRKYDSGAEIFTVQDPNVVYTIKDNLDELNLYTDEDLETFKAARFKTIRDITNNSFTETKHPDLFKATDSVAREFNDRLRKLKAGIEKQEAFFNAASKDGNELGMQKAEFERKQLDAELQSLMRFKTNLAKFGTVYSYVAQLIEFGDPELENFAAFSKLVAKRLNGVPAKEVDISGLVLTGYGIVKKEMPDEGDEANPDGADGSLALLPIAGKPNGDIAPTKLSFLQEIILLLSQTYGNVEDAERQAKYANDQANILSKDATVMAQIKNNPMEVALKGKLESAAKQAIIGNLKSEGDISGHLLRDTQALQMHYYIMYKLLQSGERLDIGLD
ncbi:type I restriction endonuclease subunit R [Brucella anthropi]|uniref:Type I restriction endonuclease subunit R n=1 Tax=Brucella anthropi TaxID=529 RepID=A0A6L3ZCG1_BRUAN|nr:DEAD/DEAH box helicase family protein [Brucella anthropi]KAB2773592.1 type I restriction endonuclease subunit R [Brucella anthropi]